MTRPARFATRLLAAGLLVALALGAPALELSVPGGRKVHLESTSSEGTRWVCLDALAKALGGQTGRDPLSRYPVWTLGGHRVLFSTATPMTSVDGKLLTTKHPAREKDGCLWVPEEFLTLGLPLVLGGPVSVDGAEAVKAVPEALPKAAEPAPAAEGGTNLEVAVAADSVRITLQGTASASAQVRREGDALLVTLPRGRIETGVRDLGSGIARSLAPEAEGRGIKVSLGAGFQSFETAALRNPERLVILLKGQGQVVPQPPPASPAPESAAASRPARSPGRFLVVLDPGHGGTDAGAVGPGNLQEKEVALALAAKVGEALEKGGAQAVLTRSGDSFVPLTQRTAIANYNRADLFVSIHLNASPAAAAKGAETYYMSKEASDLWSRQLADKENSAAGGDGGGDTLSLVLWNLAQNQYIVESSALAEAVQGKLNQLLGTKERGVRQAPFVVLEGAQMPAVLVEVAFLSNPAEANQLKDPAFLGEVADLLAQSLLEFREKHASQPGPAPAP